MALLFKGRLGRKKALVFSSAQEAGEYCNTHTGNYYDKVTVYVVLRASKKEIKKARR